MAGGSAPKPHPKAIGDQTTAFVLARLVQVYEQVLLPFGENQRYDLVVEDRGEFIRVQCKTGRLRNGAVFFPTCSTSYLTRSDGARPTQRHYRDAADVFGVYCPETDVVYLVPVAAVGTRMAALRVHPTRNNQSKKVRWAREFEVRPPG